MKSTMLSLMVIFLLVPATAFAWFVDSYAGRVIDSQTGEPVEGASVLIYWTETVMSIPESHTNFIKAKLVYTGKDGKYKIPVGYLNTSLLGSLDYTIMVVYQPGYKYHYIGESRGHTRTGKSLKDEAGLIRLDRIPPNFNHRKHYDDIDNALIGIHDYPYGYPHERFMTWNGMIGEKMKGSVEMAEFLRRAEWEERRGLEEWREKDR